MKRAFIEKEFSEENLALINFCNAIIFKYARQGFDLSLRQLYYQCVAQNVIPNNVRAYEFLGKLISDARMAGLVDWSAIVDRGRPLRKPVMWVHPSSALKNLADGFMLNRWKTQPFYLEVMVEKQALEGVLLPVCSRLGIGFSANKGYTSMSSLYEASLRYNKAFEKGKQVCVLYLGDHDCSGIDMTRDIRDRLKIFCGRDVDVKRLSLNKSQVVEHNLPPNPAKMSDSRAGSYVAKFGNHSWELDAIPPLILAGYVKSAVKRRIEPVAWEKAAEEEKRAREYFLKAARELRAIEKDNDRDDDDTPPEPMPVE